MPSVQKIAFSVGLVLLAGTALIKLDILRPGPDTRLMEERQAAALRVRVAKIRETNAAAEKRLAELRAELEAQMAATLAIKMEIALPPPGLSPFAPAENEEKPVPSNPAAKDRGLNSHMRALFEKRMAQNRVRVEGPLRALGLTSAETARVLELLTAEASPVAGMMGLGESASVPTVTELTVFTAKIQAELQELLGPQGVGLLAQIRAEAIQVEDGEEAVLKIAQTGDGRLSSGGEEAAKALARMLHENKFIGVIIGERQPWSVESEARIRQDRALLWAQWVAQEGAAVSPVEQARIKTWFDHTTESNIATVAGLVQRMRGQP